MLVICPLHSITSPTVGVGYLASHLKARGTSCPILDLNIGLYQSLARAGVSEDWLNWIFPYGERTFGGELLMSMACLDHALCDIKSAAQNSPTPEFRDFFDRLSIDRLATPEAARICSLARAYLDAEIETLAGDIQDWLGISVVATSQPAVIYLLTKLKTLRPDVRIVLGGPHFNRDNAHHWARAFPEVDAVIVGEARQALLAWVNKDEASQSYQLVRASSGPALVMSPRELGPWDPADWSDIHWESYVNATRDLDSAGPLECGAIPVIGARGCSYNRCTFCYEVLLAPRYQPREVAQVAIEIQHQMRVVGTKDVFLTDLDLNGNYERTVDLCAELRDRAPGLRFHCWLRAHELDEPMLQLLYDAGMRSYFVGIEAINDHILELIRKGYTAAHARETVRIMARFAAAHPDVRYGFNLIPNYPGETVEDVLETFDFIYQNRSDYCGHTAALYEFALTVNTIAWLQREKLGLRNFFGWNGVLLPAPLAVKLPSHRYWYDDPDVKGLHRRRLLWDHIRILVGHEPVYLERT